MAPVGGVTAGIFELVSFASPPSFPLDRQCPGGKYTRRMAGARKKGKRSSVDDHGEDGKNRIHYGKRGGQRGGTGFAERKSEESQPRGETGRRKTFRKNEESAGRKTPMGWADAD